jgi:hypothetical protein
MLTASQSNKNHHEEEYATGDNRIIEPKEVVSFILHVVRRFWRCPESWVCGRRSPHTPACLVVHFLVFKFYNSHHHLLLSCFRHKKDVLCGRGGMSVSTILRLVFF